MANVEAFLSHCNCLTLVPFLCLLVTWDLPLGAFCVQHEYKSVLPFIVDLMHELDPASQTNYVNIPSSLRTKGFSTRGSIPAESFSDEPAAVATTNSRESLTLTTSRSTRSRLNEAAVNNKNNDILIFPNANKGGPSSSPGSHQSKHQVRGDSTIFTRGDSSYSRINFSRPRRATTNNKHNTFNGAGYTNTNSDADADGTTTSGIASTKVNNLNEPSAYSTVKALSQMLESPTLPEQVERGLEHPFPVAYLMNSQYEMEPPPPMISNPLLELGRDTQVVRSRNVIADQNKIHFQYQSSSDRNSQNPVLSRADDLDISLLQANPKEENGGVNKNIENEISSNNPTTNIPQEETALIVEQIPTNEPTTAAEGEEPVTGIEIEDMGNSNNLTVTEELGTTPLRGKCNETSQCFGEHVECRLGICKCQLGYLPRIDNGELCGEASAHHVEVPTTDPTMIGVVVGLALMSVTLCIVLRLFAKARFRENRTIFNTPNPRLMNVSLLKGSKTLLRGNSAGQRSRRGSAASIASQSGDVRSPGNENSEGNGAGSSSHPHRIKPSRTLSTDTANLEGTPTSSRPLTSNRSKFRQQDSVASNV